MISNGLYTAGYYAKCGDCGKHYGFGLRDQPTLPDKYLFRTLREEGWSQSKHYGVLCPDCKPKHKRGKK